MSSGAAEFQRGFRGDRLDISDAAHAVGSKNFFILHRPANETPEGLLVNGNYAEDATERVPPVGLLVDGRAKSGLMNSVRASFQRVKKITPLECVADRDRSRRCIRFPNR